MRFQRITGTEGRATCGGPTAAIHMKETKPQITEGWVRRIQLNETVQAGLYASITVAGDPAYYLDFDDPEFWEDKRHTSVWITWVEATNNTTGYTYRRIIDAEVAT